MVDALVELNDLLISRKITLTTEENKLFDSWKTNAVKDFGIGAAAGSIATWLVTRRLHNLLRVNLAVGAGWFYGKWRFGRSLDSSAELILSQNGTRLQKELGEIMLKQYQHNPHAWRHFSKYFYSENVYDDDSSDLPKPRLRFRSIYTEIFSQDTNSDDSSSKETHLENTNLRKTNIESKQISMNGAAPLESTEDPFDCILGHQVSVEEFRRPDAPTSVPTKRKHSHKRSHGRRRMHHQDNMPG